VQDQPVEEEQAQGAGLHLGARLPHPDRQRANPRDVVPHGQLASVGGHRCEQLGVVFEDTDDALPV